MKKKIKDLTHEELEAYCSSFKAQHYGGCVGCPFLFGFSGCYKLAINAYDEIKDKKVELNK